MNSYPFCTVLFSGFSKKKGLRELSCLNLTNCENQLYIKSHSKILALWYSLQGAWDYDASLATKSYGNVNKNKSFHQTPRRSSYFSKYTSLLVSPNSFGQLFFAQLAHVCNYLAQCRQSYSLWGRSYGTSGFNLQFECILDSFEVETILCHCCCCCFNPIYGL